MNFMKHRGRTSNMNRTSQSNNIISMVQPRRKKNIVIKNREEVIIDDKPKMKWGPPVWFFFHTLAEKVHASKFEDLKPDIMDIIRSVCNTLPCPICAEHATNYMKKIHDSSIQSKDDLKLMLFQFHNEVNKRKGYQEFPLNELNKKYESAVTINVVNSFIMTYREKSRNVQMIATEMSRDMILRNIRGWLNSNLINFDT
jgi:hypothetical protein